MSKPLNWADYLLVRGNGVSAMWRSVLSASDRKLLYVMGLGFDPRMCAGIESLAEIDNLPETDVLVVQYDEGVDSPSLSLTSLIDANERRLEEITSTQKWSLTRWPLKLYSAEGHATGGREISQKLGNWKNLGSFSDIVLDVSALPRNLYFPLLARLLSIIELESVPSGNRNLYVVVAQSPEVDAVIQEEGTEESAAFLYGFSSAEFELEATRDQPRIWLPVLGRGKEVQLQRIEELVTPDEICPILPAPSNNPRESDELFLEYRELLFDRLRVEPRNIIYASESNPFDVYRQIVTSILHYQDALDPLGGCKAVISPMSSKLSSLGALLAAYELNHQRVGDERITVGVAHVEAHGYRIENENWNKSEAILYGMWLHGDCYDGG